MLQVEPNIGCDNYYTVSSTHQVPPQNTLGPLVL